ncbi:serine/threonine-protein kinase [Nitrospirillum iridis]|uniref:non-specific serine/threonine protein kinase n=1 Tax=Nitrospirillum iridis TaxID=765888 RepID=A0A7X0AVV6_9PROT|nr:serine/threonine-protein kinase [Nitrospirillum iridis]MBB6251074.1 serine/threonine-protein kinase [Nitrospirillum iridis]
MLAHKISKISKYEIGPVIGSGSYGTVVQATDRVLNRTVALKILRPGDSSAGDLKRHLREARALARLQHPNIVAIFDLEQDGDQTFLAMEHIEGETLALRLARGPLALDVALDMAAQLADALAAAHGQGVVHADLKPGNVILDRADRPRLVDFGLARLSAPSAQDTLAAATEAEGLRGTVAYMAPELFMGAAPDTRTDIFAFGALVFEMLGGRRAFDAPSDGAVMQRILNGRPERLSAAVPPAVCDLVERMLAADPAARPPAMDQVRDTLRAAGRGAAAPPPAARWRWPTAPVHRLLRRLVAAAPGLGQPRARRRLWAAGGLAGLLLAAVLGLVAAQGGLNRPPAPPSLQSMIAAAMDRLYHSEDKGAIDAAVSGFQQVLARDSSNAAATAGLSLALFRRYSDQQPDPVILQQADAAARLALSLDDQLALAHVAVGWSEYHANIKDESIRQFQKALILEEGSVFAIEGLSSIYKANGLLGSAIETLRNGLEKHPDYSEFYFKLGAIYFSQTAYAQAEAMFRKSVELAPDSAYGYANLSAAQHMQGRTVEAIQTVQRGLRIRPLPQLYNNLGNYFYFLGQYPQAAEAFERLTRVEGYSQHYITWGNLGDAYRWTPGKAAEAGDAYRVALRHLDTLLASTPQDPTYNVKAAFYHAKLGEGAAALPALDRALAGNPTPNVLFNAAVANEVLGRRDQALDLLARARAGGYAASEIDHEPELAQLRLDRRYQLSLIKKDDTGEQ